jgi:hypothetical protein
MVVKIDVGVKPRAPKACNMQGPMVPLVWVGVSHVVTLDIVMVLEVKIWTQEPLMEK